MSNKHRTDVLEKVGEIKRMQANWLRERSQMMQEGKTEQSFREQSTEVHVRKSREKGTKKEALANKSETISWTCSSGPKKKPNTTATTKTNAAKPPERQKTLRTRSASPARNSSAQKPSTSKNQTHGKISSRPSSARSNLSEGSRPPSGKSTQSSTRPVKSLYGKKDGSHKSKNSDSCEIDGLENYAVESHRSVADHFSDRSGQLSTRFNSEPNLSDIDRGGGDVLHPGGDAEMAWHDPVVDREEDNFVQAERERGKPTLDPDSFDRLADQIASKVKREMKEENGDLMDRIGYTTKSIILDDDGDGGSRIEGHYCGKCKQHMVPPDHAPTMLVPCGHTFCEACCEDRIKCPTCRTKVTSTSVNSALQDVIMASSRPPGYTTKNTPITSKHHNGATRKNSEYTPAKYTDHRSNHSQHGGDQRMHDHRGNKNERNSVNADVRTNNNNNFGKYDETSVKGKITENSRTRETEDIADSLRSRRDSDFINEGTKQAGFSKRRISPEEEARKLGDEYQSLGIRCEALESEESDVLERIEKQNNEIVRHKQQIGKIGQKQQDLRDEIKVLEGRLADLQGHRQEFKRQVEEAEDRKKEELDQLAMVRTMLRDMQRNRERVKMSARKLNLSLD